jgi:hypothetical protein
MSTCQVNHCRYSSSHTTQAHRCGTCGEFGHGQMECREEVLKDYLQQFNTDIMSQYMWCDLCPSTSEFRKTHTRDAHVCQNCLERTTTHSHDQCIIQDFDVFKQRFAGMEDLETFETHLLQQHGDNIYTILYAGMGCSLYVRHKNGTIKALFMHQDAWGQYGPTSDDTPKLNKFIEDCEQVDKVQFQPSIHMLPPSPTDTSIDRVIQCPICRTENPSTSIKMVYGTEDKCKICFEQNITKFFGECGHLVACNDCFESL